MTKLYALPIAAILCLGLAAPSFAFFAAGSGDEEGSLGVSGYFELSGEKQDHSYAGTETSWAEFYDDVELAIRASKGDFAAVADLTLSDSVEGGFQGHDSQTVVIDNYWMEWAATDNITVKAGEYALNFGRLIGVYDAGGHNIGVSYRMDLVDLGLTIGKVVEGRTTYLGAGVDEDQDIDQYVLTAETKDLGPFARLGTMVVLETDQIGDTYGSSASNDSCNASFIGVDFEAKTGPVALSGEFGRKSGERYDYSADDVADLKGNYFMVEAGLGEVMPDGFDLTVTLFNSSKDYTGPFTVADHLYSHTPLEDHAPLEILFDEVNNNEAYTQALILMGTYAWSDRLRLFAHLVPVAQVNGDQADVFGDSSNVPAESGDSWGTEYDLGFTYDFSKSISYLASYAKFSEGDVKTGDVTQYYNSLTFRY